MNQKLETSPEELFMLLGEKEFLVHRHQEEIRKLYKQIDEMANEITRLNSQLGAAQEEQREE